MRILLFLFAILELAAHLALLFFALAIGDNPSANGEEEQWQYWMGLVGMAGVFAALLAGAYAIFPSRWQRIPAMLLYGVTLVCSVPLGFSGLEIMAGTQAEGGEWAGMAVLFVAVFGVGGAVLIGALSLVMLILLTAVKPRSSAATPTS